MAAFHLIVNPTAAAGKAGRQYGALADALREGGAEPFEVALTKRAGHAESLVREALSAGAEGVAVMGGDGTLSEALRGFFSEDSELRPVRAGAWLAPMPCGTGGDFRRTIGAMDGSVKALAKRFLSATPRPLDVGFIEYVDDEGTQRRRPFLNVASFGLGGLVDRAVNEGPKWLGGRLAFLAGTLSALRDYRGRSVRVEFDDGTSWETNIANVAVANGQYFGGGMHIAPGARIDDGLFDVVLLPQRDLIGQMRDGLPLYTGRILERPGVRFARTASLRAVATGDQDVLLDVDGEAPGRLPARFWLRSEDVRLR